MPVALIALGKWLIGPIGKWLLIGGAVYVGYLVIDGRGFDRGVASVDRQLAEARALYERERIAFNARLNRIAGSIKRRCLAGEQLPECADLER